MVAKESELDPTLVPGYRLDRYELLCPIASGGMASVWLAQLRAKRGFEKLFAVKTIKTELIADPRFQDMFLDEARLASRIEHPNIAQILDLGEKDEILYTVMEWVDGESLAKIHRIAQQRKTPIPPGVALRIMSDALAGLQAAHELKDETGNLLGVVHRDVSPQNILVTSNGAVKVIDFGVAKAKNRLARDTSGGAVKGKIHYLAPEQTVEGASVDHRADLWAAAICLYELVTGKEPYGELGDVDVLRKLMSDDPAPRLNGLPERLIPIVPILDRALARDPAGRYESAAAMRRAFLGAMDELGLTSSSEETADFLRTHLSDLEKTRRARVTRATEAAKARERGRGGETSTRSAPASISGDELDVAFAPTIAGDPHVTPPPASSDPMNGEEAKTTAPATLTEQIDRQPGPGRRLETALIAAAVITVAAVIMVLRGARDETTSPRSAASVSAPTSGANDLVAPERPNIAPSPALPSSKEAPGPTASALPKLPAPTPSAEPTTSAPKSAPTSVLAPALSASATPEPPSTSIDAGAVSPSPSASHDPATPPAPTEEEAQ
jgi:eukaryotic-like serine/threonine-protein kinase